MRAPIRSLWLAGVVVASLGPAPAAAQAFGSPVVTVLTVEGNAVCNQFAINANINQLQVNTPGASFTASESTQSIEGVVVNNRLSWEATVPVNFAIVTRTGGPATSHVYVFGSGGTTFDVDETAPGGGPIQRVRFCYGLPGTALPAIPLFECEEIGQSCPTNGSEEGQVITIWDLANPNELTFCTCGVDFSTCDLSPTATENACFPRNLEAVPSVVEYFNTPFCLTSTTGGTPRTGACK